MYLPNRLHRNTMRVCYLGKLADRVLLYGLALDDAQRYAQMIQLTEADVNEVADLFGEIIWTNSVHATLIRCALHKSTQPWPTDAAHPGDVRSTDPAGQPPNIAPDTTRTAGDGTDTGKSWTAE